MEYERLYPRTRVSAPVYIRLVPEEFIKYEICCEGKHGNVHAICDAKFTSRTSVYCAPFKGFRIHSYIEGEGRVHGNFVHRFKLHRYYISDARNARNVRGDSLLTGTKQRVASIDYCASLTASLNATRVVRQTRCNDHSCTLTQRIFSYTNTIRSCVSILREQYV